MRSGSRLYLSGCRLKAVGNPHDSRIENVFLGNRQQY
jgi:hypothetical protein